MLKEGVGTTRLQERYYSRNYFILGTIHKLSRQERGEGVSQMPMLLHVVNLPTEGGGHSGM